MENFKIRSIALLAAASTLLSGCNLKQETKSDKKTDINNVEHQEIIDNNQVKDDEIEIIGDTEKFTYFSDAKSKIEEYYNSEDYENMKSKGKEYIVTSIDFIFFDKPINGHYFNELPEAMKEDALADIEYIDSLIMKKYPNYKDTLEEKYNMASSFIQDKYLDALETIKEYIGKEDYEALTRIKNKVKEDLGESIEKGTDFIKDKAGIGLDYVKEKYNGWKSK